MMKDYYKSYETMHNNVIKACDCIGGNPCSNLQSEFENIKSQISGLSLEDGWQDSVGDAFSGVKSSCVSGLDTIIQSISGPFTQSETIYNELKTTLDNLKIENANYQNEYNKKPNPSSSKFKDSNGKYDDSKYQEAYIEWKDRVTKLETKCEELQTQANEKKASLDSINGNTISPSLTASLPSAAEKFSQIFTTAAFTSVMDGIDISQYLTTMEFNGQTYQVIDTTNGYQAILNKIGKQNPDGCYDYSAAYLDAIFGSSNASSKSGVATNQNLIATQDEQTALQIMAKELLEGRPCIIRVNGRQSTGTRHFVLVTGLNKNADLNNLKQSDFMIMDPASASLKVLNTNVGGQSRHLLKTEDDKGWSGREGDTQGYLIALANKDTEYLGYEGVEQGVAPHVNYNPSKTTGTARKAELAERAKQAGVTKKTTPIISNSSSQTTTPSVASTDKSAVQYTTTIPSNVKQAGYTVTCYEADGFHKSGGSVGTSWKADRQITVHNAWNANGSKYENGLAVINDNGTQRYLVATSSEIGKVGDRLTVHFNSGESIDVLVADQKSSGDSNYTRYGHQNPSGSINILEFEVNTADYNSRGNPGTSNWKLSWDNSSGISSIDNHGSALNDLKGKVAVKA